MALNPEYFQIGYDIIGAAYDVRNNVGRGLREKYYEAALCNELRKRGYEVECQVPLPAIYSGEVITDSYLADIVVDKKVIIEVKAITTMSETESRQLYTYLRMSHYKLGYLINFGSKSFKVGTPKESLPYRNGIYRIVNNI